MSAVVVSGPRQICKHDTVYAVSVVADLDEFRVIPRCLCGDKNPRGMVYGATATSEGAAAEALGRLIAEVLGGRR